MALALHGRAGTGISRSCGHARVENMSEKDGVGKNLKKGEIVGLLRLRCVSPKA